MYLMAFQDDKAVGQVGQMDGSIKGRTQDQTFGEVVCVEGCMAARVQ
jgi:hypothetical protein